MSKNISIFGLILTILALFFFTFFVYKIAGYWCILFGPIITLYACQSKDKNGCHLWEKSNKGGGIK